MTPGDLPAMLDDLEELVLCESFSSDHGAVAASAAVVARLGVRHLGAEPETLVVEGVTHLRWSFGTPRVLLLGHHDTVWPTGSLRAHPFSVTGGVARGPGVFDMKAGLVQLFHALRSLPSLDGVCVLVTGDEELGSPTSRPLIEEIARDCAASLVLEASADGGALKTSRKGVSHYRLEVEGLASHAGLEPHKGRNAGIEVAHQVLAIAAMDGGDGATTVTPTLLSAGTSVNTVPARGSVAVDVRAVDLASQREVDARLRALTPKVPGVRLELSGGLSRPPMEAASSAALFKLAERIAAERGLGPLRGVAVGGGSDGNFSAGVGCPTLDGLGAVGGGAHAAHEHVIVEEMPRRCSLLAGLVAAVLAGPA
ncbi:glutamate carboxypeptidase [Sphaerisporangium siamense]|uniref:Glutamate carboxypeptidase n=1 Tax=Sphaerisporangium siamense TaxID=795645 RepID=A0A7W7D9C2_9ACTN|nr:M20/M25/M40 family metallo-hydrolase [Sphaerisporangium siamense]MBB4702660.1 glutamate carboxypeptidase [Sphaerisporangium siamense]GII83586.1 glutamate carboxypeptidase [Sphaerisporangium siamense]